MANTTPYRQRLQAAIERSPLSKRQIGAMFATECGLKDTEAGRRALYKYLAPGKPGKPTPEPSPERAAILAAILGAAELASVSDQGERRRANQVALAAEVASNIQSILALREAVAILLGAVVGLGADVPELPADALPPADQGTGA